MYHLFPRFECARSGAFFVVTTSEANHIECKAENIEHSPMGLPHPKLAVYAQSLIDTQNVSDLNDLVDGQDLSLQWGEKNLKLDGDADSKWGDWRIRTLENGLVHKYPDWRVNPRSRRELWENAAQRAVEEEVWDEDVYE
jgi:hypothetical protein